MSFSRLHLQAISNCTILDVCCVANKSNRTFWTTLNLIQLQSIINKANEIPIALAWFYADRDVVFSMYPKYDENLLFVQVPVNECCMNCFHDDKTICVQFLADNIDA
jgi:hypothetical protein